MGTNLCYEEEREDFLGFGQEDIAIHLNGTPIVAFHNLVSEDILFVARAYLSYRAAFYSSGIVI
jgi:hypothetical protein